MIVVEMKKDVYMVIIIFHKNLFTGIDNGNVVDNGVIPPFPVKY